MDRKMVTALMAAASLAACSREGDRNPKAATTTTAGPAAPTEAEVEAAKAHVKITPAVPADVTGPERDRMQADMIESMASSPDISPEEYEGEAYRRGVKPTQEQISRKKASYRPPSPKDAKRGGRPTPSPADPA